MTKPAPQLLDLLDQLGVQDVLWKEGVEAALLAAQDRVYQIEGDLACVGNLLARIHGDGGHYQEEHGIAKSCADAENIVINLRREVACLQESHDILVHSEDPW